MSANKMQPDLVCHTLLERSFHFDALFMINVYLGFKEYPSHLDTTIL
jgi:hypothetical protein